MNHLSDYIAIGHISKTTGYKGELKVHVEERYQSLVIEKQMLFIEDSPIPLPYFIESISKDNDEHFKFEGVSDREQSLSLTSKAIYLLADMIPADSVKAEKPVPGQELIGLMMIDKSFGELGRIIEIEEFPQQIIATISYKEKRVLIPLNSTFIVEINEATKSIQMNLPEGILEV